MNKIISLSHTLCFVFSGMAVAMTLIYQMLWARTYRNRT